MGSKKEKGRAMRKEEKKREGRNREKEQVRI